MKKITTAKICVSIAADTIHDYISHANSVAGKADVVEIRLDYLQSQDNLPRLVKEVGAPVLFTNRPEWEGGKHSGTEEDRLSQLHHALDCKPAYLDIELNTDVALRDKLILQAKSTATKTIVSWHSFERTPSSQALAKIFQNQYRSTADIGKIVTMAHSFDDVLRVLNLQVEAAEMNFPLIAFCMGRTGAISRVATLFLNGFMTYASLDNSAQTAPGQIPLADLCAIKEKMPHES